MKELLAFSLMLLVVACGCSSGPQHLAASDFQQRYLAYRGNSLEGYAYAGETNGDVYMLWMRAPLLSGSKLKEKLYFTEAGALPPSFLEQMRKEPKVEPAGAAKRGQPSGAETNGTPGAAGPGR